MLVQRVMRMALAIGLLLTLAAGCHGSGKATEVHETPNLARGNEWVYVHTYRSGDEETEMSYEHEVSLEVVGEETVEGRRCWVVQQSWPAPEDRMLLTAIDQETYLPLEKRQEWTQDVKYTMVESLSYEIVRGESLWPLAEGKEIELEQSASRDVFYNDVDSGKGLTWTTTITCCVESVEEVSVPAGTFNCFKIVESRDGVRARIWWYSEEVGREVRTESLYDDFPSVQPTTTELLSYPG